MILGLDEVGRGSWAGPLVIGLCALPNDCQIDGLTDSKKLTAKRREELNLQIKDLALGIGLGWVEANELDKIGMTAALKLAAKRALSDFMINYSKKHHGATAEPSIERIVIDGTIKLLDDPRVMTLVKADALVPSVSAASIIAKVARDRFMVELSQQKDYQYYHFEKNVGYGTKGHHQAILKYGVTDQHRLSFRPISELVNYDQVISSEKTKTNAITTKNIGDWGEREVVNHLQHQGFTILAQNWRTKSFEIDIVAQKSDEIYLIEVKTRKNSDFGGGEAAINTHKKHKLKLAAEAILSKYPDATIKIYAIFVTGNVSNFVISELIELEF
ncbi:MAG: ribonuclease HII [Candidatus Saccharibacteria bacterium]|nr:ribonuclease HII [Candidatus Saccharibacteria bacterium]